MVYLKFQEKQDSPPVLVQESIPSEPHNRPDQSGRGGGVGSGGGGRIPLSCLRGAKVPVLAREERGGYPVLAGG